MSSAPLLQSPRHGRHVIDRPEINRFERTARPERKTTMFRKIAGSLLAATLLTAPALAEGLSKNPAPAAVTQPVKADVKAPVKADATVKTHRVKHARKHFRSHVAKHGKSVKVTKSLKPVKHIKTSKRFHVKSGAQASTKSLTKTRTN
jgi:hypothetical protein